jgi:iron complex outermembrane receptor protein
MRTSNFRKLLLASAAFAAAAGAAQAASAQGAAAPGDEQAASSLEEIVVTARRREENLQSTPVAITAVSADALEAHNVTTLAKISQIAPNMTTFKVSGSVGTAGNFIRGVGFQDLILGQDAPIGIYIDGVYNGRNNIALMQLVEPQRVEILRGPQGTLFGRNTTGGAISITTRTPSDQFGGEVKASYGTYNAYSFQGRIDTGLLGNSGIKMSASYQHRQQDGEMDNLTQPRDNDPNAFKSDAFWLKAVGEWGKLSASFTADYNDVTGTPNYLQIVAATPATANFLALSPTLGGGRYIISSDPQYKILNLSTLQKQHVWSEGLALTLNYEINDHLSIKSISSLRAYKRNDPSPNGPADLRGNTGTPSSPVITSFPGIYVLDVRQSNQRQYTQEVQLLGNLGDFEYVAGVFYFHEKGWEFGRTRLPAAISAAGTALNFSSVLDYGMVNKSLAGFSQVNYRPSFADKKLELTGGVRWTKDTKDLDQRSTVRRLASLTTKNWSFLGSVNYQWTSDLMTYAKFSTGYRAGGFNVRATAAANPVYTPEKMKSWEAGFKLEAFEHRLRLNGAAFYNKYRDLQVAQFAPPSTGGAGGASAINANAKYPGFELEAQAVPVDGLTLTAAVGYVDPKYKRYPTALLTGGAVAPGCVAINNAAGTAIGMDCADIAKVTAAPKTTFSGGVAYVFPRTSYGEWSMRVDYAYKGRTQWGGLDLPSTPFQDEIVGKAYGLLSARIALADIPLDGGARAQLAVYGENLLDKDYVVSGIDFGFMGTQAFGTRRTLGIEGKVDF